MSENGVRQWRRDTKWDRRKVTLGIRTRCAQMCVGKYRNSLANELIWPNGHGYDVGNKSVYSSLLLSLFQQIIFCLLLSGIKVNVCMHVTNREVSFVQTIRQTTQKSDTYISVNMIARELKPWSCYMVWTSVFCHHILVHQLNISIRKRDNNEPLLENTKHIRNARSVNTKVVYLFCTLSIALEPVIDYDEQSKHSAHTLNALMRLFTLFISHFREPVCVFC